MTEHLGKVSGVIRLSALLILFYIFKSFPNKVRKISKKNGGPRRNYKICTLAVSALYPVSELEVVEL